MPAFTTSEESFTTEELLNAYQAGDADLIAKLISTKSLFMDIDNQVWTPICWIVHRTLPVAALSPDFVLAVRIWKRHDCCVLQTQVAHCADHDSTALGLMRMTLCASVKHVIVSHLNAPSFSTLRSRGWRRSCGWATWKRWRWSCPQR